MYEVFDNQFYQQQDWWVCSFSIVISLFHFLGAFVSLVWFWSKLDGVSVRSFFILSTKGNEVNGGTLTSTAGLVIWNETKLQRPLRYNNLKTRFCSSCLNYSMHAMQAQTLLNKQHTLPWALTNACWNKMHFSY